MKRGLISAFRSEVWLLARHPATALMIALAAVLYVVAAATSSEVLIMVAGDDPYMLGGGYRFYWKPSGYRGCFGLCCPDVFRVYSGLDSGDDSLRGIRYVERL